MSGANVVMREAEYLGCGFLAVQSQETIARRLGRKELTDEDKLILGRASEFLKNIADGADLVSTGRSGAHNSRASMQALDFAMGPLESLQSLIGDGKIAEFFRGLATATEKASHDEIDTEQLQCSKQFFEVLYHSTLETLNNDFPQLGERSRKPYL